RQGDPLRPPYKWPYRVDTDEYASARKMGIRLSARPRVAGSRTNGVSQTKRVGKRARTHKSLNYAFSQEPHTAQIGSNTVARCRNTSHAVGFYRAIIRG